MLDAALLGGVAVLGYVIGIWLLSLALKNASIMDIFWGPGFLLAAIVYTVTSPEGFASRQVLVLSLVGVWGLRLGAHIFVRNAGHGEDFRYRKWREDAPSTFWWRSLFRVFLLQGFLCWIISAPLLFAAAGDEPSNLTPFDFAGLTFWIVGFAFEAAGDFQLAQFKSDPESKGQVMNRGLWRYTRHPNYFGEATLWWGYSLIAAATPWGWASLYSPALMTFLLVRVSGATLLESGLKKRRAGYDEYIRQTSGFVPWLPRRRADR